MIAQFALRLTFGMGIMWLLMPRKEVTAGFFKIQMRVVLGLCILAALSVTTGFIGRSADQQLFSPTTSRILCGITAAIAYFGSVFWLYDWRKPGTWVMVPIVGLAGAVLMVGYGYQSDYTDSRRWLQPLSEFSSSLLIGSTVVGMLLGHWYLTSPTMTIKPLSVMNHCVLAAVILRLIVSLIGLNLAWSSISTNTQVIWLSLRWIAGIASPFLVWFLVWRILRYKNTQSATGVLFSGVIVTFIGEMTAALLFTELPYPV
ncbi:MAG: hypothetical protein AB8G99_00775 [Planctomycetaceae bacterium]